ncbi:hypothetical protein COCMIDRAFT_5075 [Bipolaris oryzae ATCC 44560]|uniref:Uncharacterized protein n=1 Tax=Bipolaris oryzae ATCC 44560 TaxID=930090 RepID=W6Z7J4_COCMI|nr:uncharacterized protein COCMIDRAFT_5075 [Bipolaris oryzae ATCC 44560]EUC45743.1 hypothetical protein COCMIDRAFT_5075 [Bipolaris oryzae ATCC 44560]
MAAVRPKGPRLASKLTAGTNDSRHKTADHAHTRLSEATGPPPITAAHGSLSRLHTEHPDQDAHRPKHFSNLSGRSLEGPRPAGGGDRGDQAPLASAGTVLALQEEASMSAALSKAPMLWRRMGVDLATLQISSAALLPPAVPSD